MRFYLINSKVLLYRMWRDGKRAAYCVNVTCPRRAPFFCPACDRILCFFSALWILTPSFGPRYQEMGLRYEVMRVGSRHTGPEWVTSIRRAGRGNMLLYRRFLMVKLALAFLKMEWYAEL